MTGIAIPPVDGAPDQATIDAQAQVDAYEASKTAPAVVAPVVEKPAETLVTETPAETVYRFATEGMDPALVENVTALAKELGLSNEAGQALLNKESARQKESADARTAIVDAWKPGGTEWTKRNDGWIAEARKDPALGKTPDEFDASLLAAKQAVAKFFPPEIKAVFDDTGYGSHPAVLRGLAAIGKAMSEGTFVHGAPPQTGAPKTLAERMYGGNPEGPTADAVK